MLDPFPAPGRGLPGPGRRPYSSFCPYGRVYTGPRIFFEEATPANLRTSFREPHGDCPGSPGRVGFGPDGLQERSDTRRLDKSAVLPRQNKRSEALRSGTSLNLGILIK